MTTAKERLAELLSGRQRQSAQAGDFGAPMFLADYPRLQPMSIAPLPAWIARANAEQAELDAKATAKTTSERVDKLRKGRAALGLKRKEVYVHDDDWPELLKLAKRLERRRTKLLASGAG